MLPRAAYHTFLRLRSGVSEVERVVTYLIGLADHFFAILDARERINYQRLCRQCTEVSGGVTHREWLLRSLSSLRWSLSCIRSFYEVGVTTVDGRDDE